MALPLWLRLLSGAHGDSSRRKPQRRRSRTVLLHVEILEDRLTPSNWTVNSAAGTVTGVGNAGTLAFCVNGADSDTSAADITFAAAVFSSATTITLAADLNLNNTSFPTTIDGTGAGPITINGGDNTYGLNVNTGVTATLTNLTFVETFTSTGVAAIFVDDSTLTMNSVTVSNSIGGAETMDGGSTVMNHCALTNSVSPDSYGDVFLESGDMTLNNTTVSGNSIEFGGGFYVRGGSLALINSTISGNTATEGGAIYLGGGTVTMTNSVLSGNTANEGGGIFTYASTYTGYYGYGATYSGTATLTNSTINNNSASEGGGVFMAGGTVTITDSVVSGNTSSGVGGGVDLVSGSLTMQSGSTIKNNVASGNGGGIDNSGTATVMASTISGNTVMGAHNGGGIGNESGATLTVTGSTLSTNSVGTTGSGGGIWNAGTMSVTGSTLSGNDVGLAGGGIDNGGTATITSCSIGSNSVSSAGAGFGGGVNNTAGGAMTISDSVIFQNTATQGGGIEDGAGLACTLTVSNTTISGNTATLLGGGIDNFGGTLSVSNATISGNSSPGGGGINSSALATSKFVWLANSIVAGNTAVSTGPDVSGIVQAGDNNLIGNGATMVGLVGNGNLVGTAGTPINPLLVPLGLYGAALPTMPLFSTSQAVNTGGNATTVPNAITAAAPSIVVADASAIASTPGNFVIQIDSEQMLVTAVNVATNTLTVTRGYNSTAMAAHLAGAGVMLPLDEIGQSRISAGQSDMGAVATVDTVTFSTQPSNTGVGSTFAVVVHVASSNALSTQGIVFTLGISSNSISGNTTATTDSSGNATFSNLSVAVAGTYTLTAQVNGAVTATSSSFIIGGGLSTLAFSTQPSATVVAGVAFSPVVLAEDSSSSPVANVTLTLSMSSGTLNGTLTATTNSSGLATFANLSVDIAGTYTLTAASGAVNVTSNSFMVIAAAPASLAFVTQPTGTTVGGTLSPVVVQAADTFGNVEGAGVSVTVALSSGVLNGTLTGTTNGSGQVSYGNLSINTAGTYTLLASSAGATGATSNSFVITAGVGFFTFVTQPLGTTAGTILNAITVQVADALSNPLPGVSVTIGIPPATLSGGTTTAVTNSAGQVVFSNLVENLVGTYSLTASATGLANLASNSFVITAAAASTLTYLSQPSGTSAGSTLNAVTVQVADKYGNAVAGSAIGIATTSGALSAGTTPLTSNASGQVVFGNLVENVVGTYTLSASSAGVTSVLSNAFTITVAGVATLAFVSQPANATAGNVLNSVNVKALDPFGNIVVGAQVSISLNPGSLSSGTLVQTSNASGIAIFGDLIEDITGTYSLIASAIGASNITSNSFVISAAAASKLSFVSQPSSTTAGAVLNPVTVQVVDKFGNVVAGASIGIALSAGTLSTGTTPLTANSAGDVVFSDLSEDKIGTYTLTASAGAISASSNQFTITPSLATAKLSFITQPNSTTAGTVLHAITLQIADMYNNPISGASIGVALSTGNLSAGTTPLSTGAAGQVVFSDLIEDAAGTYNLVASSSGVASITSGSFVISAAAAASLTFLSQPSSTTAGSILTPITVRVADSFGNTVSGTLIGIALSAGALSTGTTPLAANSAGQVVFGDLSENTVGTFTLVASTSGVSSVLSNPFSISPAAAFKLSFVTEPNSTTAGATLNAVTVQVADKYGNAVPNASIGIALPTGSLSTGTTPLSSNALGQVSFADLSEDAIGTYTLIASSLGLSNIASSSFVITAAQATTLNFLSQPSSVAVNATLNAITLQAFDQFNNLVVGGAVSLGLATGGVLNGSTLAMTNSAGLAVFSTLSVPTGGLYNLRGSSGSATATSNPFAVTSSADKLTFLVQPTSTTAASPLNSVLVQLTDPAGDLLPGVTIKIALSANTLGGTTAGISNTSGQVTFGTLSVAKVGSYTLIASSSGIPSSNSNQFNITAGVAAKLTFISQPLSTLAGSTLSPVTVQAVDQFGNPVSGATVSISSSLGKLTGTMVLSTNALGDVVFTTLSEPMVGTCMLTASTSNLSQTSSSFSVSPVSAYQLSFVSEPISTTAGAIMVPVSVKVVDKFGNAVPGVAVSLYTSINTVNGTTAVVSNSAGLAVFTNLYITKAASYTFSAGSGTLTKAISNIFVITPAPGTLSFLTQPVGTTAGSSLGTVSLKLADKYGNLLVGVSVTARISIGTLSGVTTAATNSAGEVTFTNLSMAQAGTGYTITFSAPGATSITSNPFTITAALPPHLLFSTPPTTTAPNTVMKSVVVQLYNSNGTPLDLANLAVTVKISTGSLSGTATVFTNASGQAVFGTLEIGSAGNCTMTATAVINGQALSVTSSAFTVT